ncbi:hypothetical protein HPP92_014282 [Vanilla planifolia]|uniref:Pentatricopeptide repeat-containing protein n=1 Tax=Vanilla planifolia TaxID=51239 RepID=A0A835QPZ4_VANPL|nr:hypothetical protein HPP92_014282 [Vanilla planifolia]
MVSYGIEPRVEHYGCLIDMLGRAGFVAEALKLVGRMPVEPGPVVWSSLLSACRNQGEASLAEIVAKNMIESDPNNGSPYVLLSHVYGKLGRWDDFRIAKKVMMEKKLTKVAGTSWIEIDGYIHKFVSGDRFHLKTKEIYAVLDALSSF